MGRKGKVLWHRSLLDTSLSLCMGLFTHFRHPSTSASNAMCEPIHSLWCFIYAGLKLLRTVASYLKMVWPKFCGRKHAAGRGSWACSPRKKNVIRSLKIASATLIFLMLLLLFVLFFSGGPKIPVILGKQNLDFCHTSKLWSNEVMITNYA